MNLILIADSFRPSNTSAAIQLNDLSYELIKKGHNVNVITFTDNKEQIRNSIYKENGLTIIRIYRPSIKNKNYFKRTIIEFISPFKIIKFLKKSDNYLNRIDGIVWYSPSIFFGVLIGYLKKKFKCPSYLILRDHFPDWAVDLGLMSKGPHYWFFKAIESYQFYVADVIGVQSEGNISHVKFWKKNNLRKVEVLNNWISDEKNIGCSIDISKTKLSGRKIFLYAGNMGVAQNPEVLLELAKKFKNNNNLGFLFVGRGEYAKKIRNDIKENKLDNCETFSEIKYHEIPGLYSQCHVGMLSLNFSHKSHNIPGKFISYISSGLPVLAIVNKNNDLIKIINENNIGQVITENNIHDSKKLVQNFIKNIDRNMSDRCKKLKDSQFSSNSASEHILKALSP